MAAPGGAPKRAQHDEYKMVGHYKVKAALGEGVNGAVRLGIDTRTGEKVRRAFLLESTRGARDGILMRTGAGVGAGAGAKHA